MGNSPSSARDTENIHKEAGGTAATPPSAATGASCASSFEKTVLLHDWWLIRAKDEWSRARLAVGGLATTGKAVRIFSSAPIVKRYDGYTLETADGIIVRIQGLINASRMHHNGFPSEACSHFRIGFPYSWKDYADRYFRIGTEGNDVPTCASDDHDRSTDSAHTASYDFPVCLKELPVGRIVDCLNSICKEIVDHAQRSTDTTHNSSKNNHNNENTNCTVTPADQNIDRDNNCPEENIHVSTLPKNDALGTDSLSDGLKKSNNYVLKDSSLCGSMITGSPLEKVAGFQVESLMTVVTGPDIEKERVGHISIDPVDVEKDVNGNMSCINATPGVESGAKVLLNNPLPENGKESESLASREDHLTEEAERVVCLSDVKARESDVEVMNSPGIESQMIFVNPVSSDTLGIANRTRNSLRKGCMKSSFHSLSQNCAGMSCDEGELGVINHLDGTNTGLTRILEEPLCTERNEMHLEVSGAMENHSHTAVKHTLLHKGHCLDANVASSVASVMATPKETPKMQVAIVDKGIHEKTSLDSYMKDTRGKLSCYLNSETEELSSSVFEDVNQPQENGELSLIHSNTMDFSSERVLAECSYNETNDLQPESSGKMAGHASDSAKVPSNISINLEESSIDSPLVGMTMSEPPNKQFSLRRSERLLRLKILEDKKRFLEHNKRSINKVASRSMSHGTQNEKSSTLNASKGRSMTEASHPKSADVHAFVAHKLNFSSHKLLHDRSATIIEGTLHIVLEGKNISSKEHDVEAIQENLLKSRAVYGGHSQKNSKSGRKRNQSVAGMGENCIPSFSDDHGLMNSENVRSSHDLTKHRIEADNQNLGRHIMEQSSSDIGINCVAGHAIEACQSAASLDIQLNQDKFSGRAAKKSIRKTHLAPQTPLTRQRTKTLSFASPVNFRRSRSGRLLVPTLANWCQQILYDMDGSVAGILTGVDAINSGRRGSRSEPPRKKKKVV